MRKKVFKAIAGCAAACFMAGLIAVSGGNKDASAEDGDICNYTFDDGYTADALHGNSCTVSLVEGKNSTYDGGDASSGNCVKISARNGYWENSALAYDLTELVEGERYVVTFDIYHENQATDEFSSNRACIVHTLDDWGQIGQPMAAPSEEWERISQEFTYHKQAEKYDGTMQDVKLLYIEFAYPEATQSQGDSYKIENKEEYYIDNFSIKKYVAPTPKPEVSPTPVPPVDEPVIAPPEATPFVDTEVGSGLENGYEETVGNLLYVVTGNDTVQVKEFDTPKSSLVIPNTVVIEDYTFKVTSIAANAFKGDSDIKKLTIGANVTTIGKNAFFKCTSLKKITIKSSSITSIGKKAFKKTSAKATVKVPKAKKAAYKKLLKKAGIAKKAKIK